MEHDLKTWPDVFAHVWSNHKQFEARKDDRGFRLGDTLVLREFDPAAGTYSGLVVRAVVSYILRGGSFGIEPGHVVMSIVQVGRSER